MRQKRNKADATLQEGVVRNRTDDLAAAQSPPVSSDDLTEAEVESLELILSGTSESEKLSRLLESSPEIKRKVGLLILAQLPTNALLDKTSVRMLSATLPLRDVLIKELNVDTVADRMLLEAAIVGYTRFLAFQRAASTLMANINQHNEKLFGRFSALSLEGLKVFQETIAILRTKTPATMKVVVRESQVNIADLQQVVNQTGVQDVNAKPK